MAAIHPIVQPLSYLLGTWRGEGEGSYPTISPFRYSEELQFTHSPNKPVIAYSSKTWKLGGSGEAMHSESGYWRPKPDGTIEVVVAQSTGLVEVQKGTYDAEHRIVKLKSQLVGNASKVPRLITRNSFVGMWNTVYYSNSTKDIIQLVGGTIVKDISRVFEIVDGELSYVVEMETNQTSLHLHLKASLKKL